MIFIFLAALIHFYINRATINLHYGKVFYRLGLECQNKCSFDEQLSYFQKAVFYDPNLINAYYQLGIIYGRNGQHKEEIESYKKVVQLDHTNGEAYFKVGLHYFQDGELDYALRYFLQSNRYKPNSPDTYYYMAHIYDRQEMYKEAVFQYMRLVLGESHLSADACERIWHISKIPGQYGMVWDEVYQLHAREEQRKLWEQIDRYIRTDQVPEFMHKPDGEGHD